jgi:hypothetical protein
LWGYISPFLSIEGLVARLRDAVYMAATFTVLAMLWIAKTNLEWRAMLLRTFPFLLGAEIAVSPQYFKQIVAPWCNSDSIED